MLDTTKDAGNCLCDMDQDGKGRGERDPNWVDRCFDSCPTGYVATDAPCSLCAADTDYRRDFTDGHGHGYSSCHEPTYHSERGAYMSGHDYLRWDDFLASNEHYFAIWFRARTSGYIFNYNYEARPLTADRDQCDCFDDNNCFETKKGDFSYFFDECDEDEMWDDWYGWKQLTVSYSGNNPYQRTVQINGETVEDNSLDNAVILV